MTESITKRNRKISRYISDAYINVIKPEIIPSEHWDMWLKSNAGLTQIELAMLFRIKKFEVVQILANVVEQLKSKPPIVEKDWSNDFRTWIDAQLFRDKIRAKAHDAAKLAKKQGLKEILIMSEGW